MCPKCKNYYSCSTFLVHVNAQKSCNYFTPCAVPCKINKINICVLGRYSPVRRASEGSRNPQGPFQECQQLQNSLAAQQRNNNYLLATPTNKPENSVSLPGEEKFIQSHFWFASVSMFSYNVYYIIKLCDITKYSQQVVTSKKFLKSVAAVFVHVIRIIVVLYNELKRNIRVDFLFYFIKNNNLKKRNQSMIIADKMTKIKKIMSSKN